MEDLNKYKYRKAKERVECIKSFYSNLMTYFLVIPFLVFINYRTSSYPWVIFPAIGWGIGLVGHWLHVYGHIHFLGRDWEERKIKQFMDSKEF